MKYRIGYILVITVTAMLLCGCSQKTIEEMEWAFQTSNTTEDIMSISFADKNHGWAVTADGSILATEDAGETWTAKKIAENRLTSVCAVDKEVVWAAGLNGSLYQSTDGGVVFKDRAFDPEENAIEIDFWDDDHGIILANRVDSDGSIYGTVFRTSDGGADWSEVYVALDSATALDILEEGRGWITTRGSIWNTTDYGANWEENVIGEAISINDLHFDDYSYGFLVGDSGTYYTSFDGGWSWDNRGGAFPERHLSALEFTDRFNGIIVGQGGIILYTVDVGEHWNFDDQLTSSDLYDITSVKNRFYICGAGGTIISIH